MLVHAIPNESHRNQIWREYIKKERVGEANAPSLCLDGKYNSALPLALPRPVLDGPSVLRLLPSH